ncbi:MAG TPA: TIM barrel protein [Thermoguttaceae bacterium]|nr:TIM barrel protein [Thermoguttaceae bacterium]
MFKNLSPKALGVSGHQSEIIELALTYGFSGMDLALVDFANRAKMRGMPYARRLIDSAKIRLGTFELPIQWDTDDEQFRKQMEELPEYAQAAAEIGCTGCVATLSPAGDNRPYHENFEFHRGRFVEVCSALQPAGVRLGLGFQAAEYLRKGQTFQFIHDFDALTLLIKMVDAPNIGLSLDVWDLVAGGGSTEIIRSLSPEQIVAVQIAEMPADVRISELDKDSRLLPNAENGRINIPATLRALAELDYDGPVSVKVSRSVFENPRRDPVVKRASESLQAVWRAAGLNPQGKLAARVATVPK